MTAALVSVCPEWMQADPSQAIETQRCIATEPLGIRYGTDGQFDGVSRFEDMPGVWPADPYKG